MSWTAPILTSNGTRTKTGVVPNRRYSHAVPAGTGVSSDRTVVLGTAGSARNYPDTLRRVRFVDPEQARSLIFLTNNFELPALTIAPLYKSRWRIELFFKWIKQHLRIKPFYGVGENAFKAWASGEHGAVHRLAVSGALGGGATQTGAAADRVDEIHQPGEPASRCGSGADARDPWTSSSETLCRSGY